MNHMPVPALHHTRDHRLWSHAGELGFLPDFLAAHHFTSKGEIPACLVVTNETRFLYVNLREPLHIGHAIPTGHDQTEREPLMFGEGFAIHRVGQDRLATDVVSLCSQ